MIKLLLIFLLSFNTYAQTATALKKGDKAPFNGILITEEKAIELDKAERKVLVLSDLRIADKELSEHYRQSAKDAHKKLNKAKFEAYTSGAIGFTLGVLITCFAFKIVQESTR